MVVCIEQDWSKEKLIWFNLATGAVIGHELTHGFDNIGRLYDKNGNKYPWWSNQTSENFNNRKTCIVEQYSNYTVSQVNEQVVVLLFIIQKLSFFLMLII